MIRLNKGMAVFRPAMTIRLEKKDRRGFAKADFEPLALHYKGQVLQIHVMAEFAERGLAAMSDALRLAMDYFTLKEDEFLARWLPGRDKEIGRETTPGSWRAIVESLENAVQQRIVADDREETNVLVIAGPGSGKTRVLVHRIAYLIRARRENARSILALAYNRHAAVDIRRRLSELIGDDARGVTVLTCHALAMRLAGASFTGRADRPDDEVFREVIRESVSTTRFAMIGVSLSLWCNPATWARSTASAGILPSAGRMCFRTACPYISTVFGLQRTATCSSRYARASSATRGPSAGGSGTGSSPALIRAMISAARRLASSAVTTPWRPTVTRLAARPPARVCTT